VRIVLERSHHCSQYLHADVNTGMDYNEKKTMVESIAEIVAANRDKGHADLIDMIIKKYGCSYNTAKTQLSNARKFLGISTRGRKHQPEGNPLVPDNAPSLHVVAGANPQLLENIHTYRTMGTHFTEEQVFELARHGASKKDLATVSGLSVDEFDKVHGTAYARGEAALRITRDTLIHKIGINEKDSKTLIKLWEANQEEKKPATQVNVQVNIEGLRDRLKDVLSQKDG
jgi:hypothetical protein